jgi:hypothetical protein
MWPFKSKEQLQQDKVNKEELIIKKNKDKIITQEQHTFTSNHSFDMKNMFVVFNKTTWTLEHYNDAHMWSGIQKTVEILNIIKPLKPNEILEIVKVNRMSFSSL